MPLERKVPLLHWKGLHLWAAGQFAQAAAKFESDIHLGAQGRRANGKSILEIVALGAGPGLELTISADGPDAEVALEALETLVRNNFSQEP